MWDLKWSNTAEKEYLSILEFWIKNNLSNTYSLKIMKAVEQAEDRLMENPFIAEEKEDHKNGSLFKYRKMIILKNFSLIYIVRDKVEIISFWDNRRNPEELNLNFQ
ncbi:type II toxin-antitoxin system RelE/ParE family toxin [Ornithobacterium rhinotracheale]|uniref:type II toxin-antitoxin system RelE/ParE family toxin n=1 Tax=Ornithobacterium rhinotracheale TaxID=28251 RepID=UPI00403525B1